MTGKFIGVGVGPGDPELLTIKALHAMERCDVIAIPVSDIGLEKPVAHAEQKDAEMYLERCVAYKIAIQAYPELENKVKIFLPMPMIKEKEILKKIHDEDAAFVAKLLDQDKEVVFLTLGDPSVYSTCMYVHKRLKKMGYVTEMIPGIPSFCAAAARLDVPLVENKEELHVIPASYGIEASLHLPGTKVLMKAGRKMEVVKNYLLQNNVEAEMVENCGMADEHVYLKAEEIPEKAGYYSLLIVKEK